MKNSRWQNGKMTIMKMHCSQIDISPFRHYLIFSFNNNKTKKSKTKDYDYIKSIRGVYLRQLWWNN